MSEEYTHQLQLSQYEIKRAKQSLTHSRSGLVCKCISWKIGDNPFNAQKSIVKVMSNSRMFANEQAIWRTIDENHVPNVVCRVDEQYYAVDPWSSYFDPVGMFLYPFIAGCSMKSMVETHHGDITRKHVSVFMKQLMESLKQLHSLGIIHRDISEDNILLNGYYDKSPLPSPDQIRIHIIDFSSATGAQKISKTHVSSSCLAHPSYRAPELDRQFKANEPNKFNEKCDIFAAGKILQKLTTNNIDELCDDELLLDEDTKLLILKMTEQDPRKRPTADQVLKHLNKNKNVNCIRTIGVKRKRKEMDDEFNTTDIKEMECNSKSEPANKKRKTNDGKSIKSAPLVVSNNQINYLLNLWELKPSQIRFNMSKYESLVQFYKQQTRRVVPLDDRLIKTIAFVYFYFAIDGLVEKPKEFLYELTKRKRKDKKKHMFMWFTNDKKDKVTNPSSIIDVLERGSKNDRIAKFACKCPICYEGYSGTDAVDKADKHIMQCNKKMRM